MCIAENKDTGCGTAASKHLYHRQQIIRPTHCSIKVSQDNDENSSSEQSWGHTWGHPQDSGKRKGMEGWWTCAEKGIWEERGWYRLNLRASTYDNHSKQQTLDTWHQSHRTRDRKLLFAKQVAARHRLNFCANCQRALVSTARKRIRSRLRQGKHKPRGWFRKL